MDHKKQTFETDIGQKAQVSRSEQRGERETILNNMLRGIGAEANQMPQTSEYLGSCAVHIYKPKGNIQYLHFQCQVSPMQDVPEIVADKALTDLKGNLMEFYGRDRKKKRSGF